jgi:hypothetical protein
MTAGFIGTPRLPLRLIADNTDEDNNYEALHDVPRSGRPNERNMLSSALMLLTS